MKHNHGEEWRLVSGIIGELKIDLNILKILSTKLEVKTIWFISNESHNAYFLQQVYGDPSVQRAYENVQLWYHHNQSSFLP